MSSEQITLDRDVVDAVREALSMGVEHLEQQLKDAKKRPDGLRNRVWSVAIHRALMKLRDARGAIAPNE